MQRIPLVFGIVGLMALGVGVRGEDAVPLSPDGVLKAALEAHVRGDVEGMLAKYALDLYEPKAVDVSRSLFEMVSRKISVESFELNIRAVNICAGEQVALVRATMSYTLHAPGYDAPVTEGVLAMLVLRDQAWKLVSVNPDPLLDEELHAPPVAPEETSGKAGGIRKAGQVMDIKEVNNRIDTAMKTWKIDGAKMAADITFMTVGRVPGVGDAAAQVYQVINTAESGGSTLKDLWNYGFTRVGFLKASTVAVGVAQIVTEPIPGLDSVTDMVAMHLDQAATNAEIRRGLEEIRPYLRSATAEYKPRLLFLPEGAFQYPAGMQKATDGGEEGNPLGILAFATVFHSPEAMGRPIPFILAGQVAVPVTAAVVAEKLGAVQTSSGYWIPLDLTSLIEGPVSSGDAVLQGFRVDRSVPGAPPMVVWDATCVRGKQNVRVKLTNGELSNDVFVRNAYMNAVSELEVTNIPNGALNLKVGEVKDGIRVYGKTYDAAIRPELTQSEKCLEILSSEPGILSLRREETVALRAEKAGATTVTFALRDVSPAVANSVPVTVQDVDLRFLRWLQSTRTLSAKVAGDLTCKYTDDGSTVPCAFLFDNTQTGSGLVPVVWLGDSFTIEGTIESPVNGKCELSAAGRFNPAKNTMAGHFRTSCKYEKGTSKRTAVTEFTLGELPTLFGVVPEKEGSSYVFTLNSNFGDPASLIQARVELTEYTATHTSGGPVRTLKLDKVDWGGQVELQMSLLK